MITNTITSDSVTTPTQTKQSKARSFVAFLPTVARVLMGLFLLMCALNGVFNFLPQPKTPLPAAAIAFNMGMMKTGYMMPLIFATQGLVALLLLLNRFVPLALALLAPFLVNAAAFHIFLVPEGLVIVFFLVALELYLAWVYRKAFLPMLAMKVTPNAVP